MKQAQLSKTLAVIVAALVVGCSAHAKYSVYPHPNTVPDRANPRPEAPFLFTPYAPTFEERQLKALRHTADSGKGSVETEIARAMLGEKGELSEGTVANIEKVLAARNDCADFTAIRAIISLYVNREHPLMTDAQRDRIKAALLGFKFWVDEPGANKMIFWTENHQMVFHSTEYLAGQMFKDEVFVNNGQTGAWHMEHARKLLLTWMERRARWGFSEWDSNVYYDEDMAGLLALAEFADDPDMAQASAITIDLMFFDISSDLFKGIYGTSHGRSYDEDNLSGHDYSVDATINVLTGLGPFTGARSMSGMTLCLARRYRPSEVIIRVGQDDPDVYPNYERHGIPLEKIQEYGISRTDTKDAPVLWGMGAHTQPMVIDLFLKAADEFQLWSHPFIDSAADAANALPRDGSVGRMRKSWIVESDRTLLGEVNKLSYITKDYMISAAQSYRPGEMGNQHHIWQATLSPDALVFTTNPGSLAVNNDRTPTYWAGDNRLPRVALYKNVAIVMYKISTKMAMGERAVYPFTHAFFPKWAFDDVRETDGWIFGKAGTGYVALRSAVPYRWNDPDYKFSHDVIADGLKNIWICQMGSSRDGSFDDFIKSILAAKLSADADSLQLSYDAPGTGLMEFSWKGDLKVAGATIPLDGYKRVSNPNCEAEFDTGVYKIKHGGETLTLDFFKRIRKTEKD